MSNSLIPQTLTNPKMGNGTSAKLLSNSVFHEEALNSLGASSPFDLTSNNSGIDINYFENHVFHISVLLHTRCDSFILYAYTNLLVFRQNDFTFVLSGSLRSWRNLFLNSRHLGEDGKQVLDVIFEQLRFGNSLLKLTKYNKEIDKEDGIWRSR